MEIRSKFYDYYDCVNRLDQEDDLLYNRFQESFEINRGKYWVDYESKLHYQVKIGNWVGKDWFQDEDTIKTKQGEIVGYKRLIVGFCGKIYYLVIIYHIQKKNYFKRNLFLNTKYLINKKNRFIDCYYAYSQKDLDLVIEKLKVKKMKRRFLSSDIRDYFTNIFTKYILNEDCLQSVLNIFIRHNTPTFIIGYEEEDAYSSYSSRCKNNFYLYKPIEVKLNPCLKDLSFQKNFDPYSCYQEILMYLGGVLVQREEPIVTISETYKLAQHGFDQFSFKTMKGDKKPRKKNKAKRNKYE